MKQLSGVFALSLAVAALAVAAPSVAIACGAFVPVEGETASVDAQRVILGFNAETNTTRVIAQVSYDGSAKDFAWLIPLGAEPTNIQAMGEEAVQLVDGLDSYGAPRFGISYCGLNNGGGGDSFSGDVRVLNSGTTGTFEYVVLSGDSGEAVTSWLSTEGYQLSDELAEVADAYVKGGFVFFAMRVNAAADGGDKLDPAIRFDYEGGAAYPLRILQPSTTDEVEVILDIIAADHMESVRTAATLSNDDVAWEGEEPQYLDAVRAAGLEGKWVTEYRGGLEGWDAWGAEGGTEVSEVEGLNALIAAELGIEGGKLSRFHGIFPKEALVSDAMFRVAADADEVHSLFEIYDGSACEEEDWFLEGDDEDAQEDGDAKTDDGGGCSAVRGTADVGLLALFALGLVGVRRRKAKNRG